MSGKWLLGIAVAIVVSAACAIAFLMRGEPDRRPDEKMLAALSARDVAALRSLLESDLELANLRRPGPKGGPGTAVLYSAALAGQFEMARALVEKGADVNSRSERGLTPLHGAAFGGSARLVGFLIETGADINARSDDGKTALDLAVESRQTDIARTLRRHGAEGAAAKPEAEPRPEAVTQEKGN